GAIDRESADRADRRSGTGRRVIANQLRGRCPSVGWCPTTEGPAERDAIQCSPARRNREIEGAVPGVVRTKGRECPRAEIDMRELACGRERAVEDREACRACGGNVP